MKKERFNIILIILIAIIIGLVAYILLFANKVKVSSVSITNKGISMFVGDDKQIEVSIEPVDLKDSKLIYTSSNTGVATISDKGIITGVSQGDTIITVKEEKSEISDSCMVRVVNKEASELELLDKDVEIKINESKELNVLINPSELKDLITWTSSDERIATVDAKGMVTGIANGKTTIKAVYGDKEAISNVKVIIPVSGLEIDKLSASVNINSTIALKVTIAPEEASNQELNWKSSDPSIATVENGVVKGISEGKATITASIDGKKVACEVTVTIPADSIKLNKTSISLKKGASESLVATISPNNTTNKTITWTSSNEKVAKVDKNGKVTGTGTGKVTITATIDGKVANCDVTSIGYIITQDSKFSKQSTVVSYNSETFKYSVKRTRGDFVLIWVLDAYKQLNSALPKIGTAYKAETLLEKEISTYGYQNKGLVATNASYFWDGWGDSPCSPFMINKGKIIRDIENIDYKKNVYGSFGLTKDGLLKAYKFSKNNYTKNMATRQEMLDDGVRNNFTYTLTLITRDGKVDTGGGTPNGRTVLCQVDENNFVIYSGGSLNFGQIAKELKNTYNCQVAYNLDGGGSRKLYYKTGTMASPKQIYGGSRAIPDMLYFVEQ